MADVKSWNIWSWHGYELVEFPGIITVDGETESAYNSKESDAGESALTKNKKKGGCKNPKTNGKRQSDGEQYDMACTLKMRL